MISAALTVMKPIRMRARERSAACWLALVGEYAGASNNPEVIAPLDKLRSMIQPQGSIGGNVRFEIEGRKLVGVISNTTRVAAKSGRKSNF